MAHRVKCLGKSRGVERAKARLAAASRRAGHRHGRGGLTTFSFSRDAGIPASASFYDDAAKRADQQAVQS
jgi:hypothetical protein